MNIFKKIAEFFTAKKETAQQNHETKVSVEPTSDPSKACLVKNCGKTAFPLFSPQPLSRWYCIQQAFSLRKPVCADISQIQLLDLFNPLTMGFITTAFAIKDQNGYFWGKIGSNEILFSEFDAFIYRPAKMFRVFLRDFPKKEIVAVCKYKKGEIIVTQLLEQDKTPPTDIDPGTFIPCPLTPCSLQKAAKFVEKL